MLKKLGFALLAWLFLVPAVQVMAGHGLFEDFTPPLVFKHPGAPQRPGLWLINDGDLHNGSYQYYAPCGDSSCILSKKEDFNKWYVHMELYHDRTPGDYVNMEASELQTGYAYGKGFEQTHPTVGHPVVVTAKMRCSGCALDGTGGQVGTWGLWLWNSYPQLNPDGTFTLNPVTSIGFAWIQAGGILPGGLAMDVYKDSYPQLLQPVSGPLDLTRWHTYKFMWSVNTSGVENVAYFIDGRSVGQTTIDGTMPALSETIWHDNQLPTGFDQNGFPIVTFENPSVPQSVDTDYVSVQ